MNQVNMVTIRWLDGYTEEFECTEVKFGCDLLWMRMRLVNGQNRYIPFGRCDGLMWTKKVIKG